VVHTCHTLLESLSFSGSFGIKIYFLNLIFVNKKYKIKKYKKIKMAVPAYPAIPRHNDICQKNR
jgi:hypothetical protein